MESIKWMWSCSVDCGEAKVCRIFAEFFQIVVKLKFAEFFQRLNWCNHCVQIFATFMLTQRDLLENLEERP